MDDSMLSYASTSISSSAHCSDDDDGDNQLQSMTAKVCMAFLISWRNTVGWLELYGGYRFE